MEERMVIEGKTTATKRSNNNYNDVTEVGMVDEEQTTATIEAMFTQ